MLELLSLLLLTVRGVVRSCPVLKGLHYVCDRRIELVTGVLVLPQRQTALVAKQAAYLDRLSRARLRLGIGVGWNAPEYEAMGANFHDRGARSEEQIAVLRALWSQDVVTFQGRWHHITAAGINPRPTRGAIPIWIGGAAEGVLGQVGRLADGWISPERWPLLGGRVHRSALAAQPIVGTQMGLPTPAG